MMAQDGFFKSLGAGVLNAINGLADWIGLGTDVNRLFGAETTPQEAADLINAVVAKARTMSSEKQRQLQAKLDSLPVMQSAHLKHIIADARKKLSDEQARLSAASDLAESEISKAESLASDIPNMKLGDIAVGRVERAKEQAKQAAEKAYQMVKDPNNAINILKGVEKNV